jgi:hypothetical protein
LASQKSYRSIRASLCRLIDSIQLSIASNQSGKALQKPGQSKDGLNAAGETVLTVKTDQVALLDAVESLVSRRNLRLKNDPDKWVCRTAKVYNHAVAAEIRYLHPDQNRHGPETKGG